MIIAVLVVWEVEMAINKEIKMVSVRDGLMATGGAVDMSKLVTPARVGRGTVGGVLIGHSQDVFIDMPVMGVVQVAVVKVIRMALMGDHRVTTRRAMDMIMGLMDRVVAHGESPYFWSTVFRPESFRSVSANSYSRASVSSQPMQASVMETP